MLLSIDETKVRELMEASTARYVVAPSGPPIASENLTSHPYYSTSEVSGAVFTVPLLVTAKTKALIMSMRYKIEESGAPLRTTEELEEEIDEMRARH